MGETEPFPGPLPTKAILKRLHWRQEPCNSRRGCDRPPANLGTESIRLRYPVQQTQPAASTGDFRCGPGSIPERGRAIEPVQRARHQCQLPIQMMGHRCSRGDHAGTVQSCILGSPVLHLLSQVDTRFHDNAIDSGITVCAGRLLSLPSLLRSEKGPRLLIGERESWPSDVSKW
jgi:hypothetical protein